jgi:hypothetical protein
VVAILSITMPIKAQEVNLNTKLPCILPYHRPDSRWENCSSHAQYLDNYVFKPKFHCDVPEDIINDYKTSQYLQAHAWYYWPMYDEALKKVLGMVEMAVKIGCKQNKIDLCKNNGQSIHLAQLMKKFIKKTSRQLLKEDLDCARKIRNEYAHPGHHFYAGAFASRAIQRFINLINFIFVEKTEFCSNIEHGKSIHEQLEQYINRICLFSFNNKHCPVHNITCMEYWKVNNDWISLWVLHPIVDINFNNFNNKLFPSPFILSLKNATITESEIKGIDLTTNKPISITITEASDLITKFKGYLFALNSFKKETLESFNALTGNFIGENLIIHRYNHYWNS